MISHGKGRIETIILKRNRRKKLVRKNDRDRHVATRVANQSGPHLPTPLVRLDPPRRRSGRRGSSGGSRSFLIQRVAPFLGDDLRRWTSRARRHPVCRSINLPLEQPDVISLIKPGLRMLIEMNIASKNKTENRRRWSVSICRDQKFDGSGAYSSRSEF